MGLVDGHQPSVAVDRVDGHGQGVEKAENVSPRISRGTRLLVGESLLELGGTLGEQALLSAYGEQVARPGSKLQVIGLGSRGNRWPRPRERDSKNRDPRRRSPR